MTGASLPETGRLAVYDTPNGPFRIVRYPLREPRRDVLDLPQKAPGVDNAAGRRVLRAAIVP